MGSVLSGEGIPSPACVAMSPHKDEEDRAARIEFAVAEFIPMRTGVKITQNAITSPHSTGL